MSTPPPQPNLPGLVAIMPALDEEGSIAAVIDELHRVGVSTVLVGNNGSKDRTEAVATAHGAVVVNEQRKGYGHACLAAMARLPDDCTAVVFCDADGADDLQVLPELCRPVLEGSADLVIGSRVLGRSEPGAMTPPQVAGNFVSAALIRLLYGARVTDLGPFRCVSRAALERLAMEEKTYGWTVEMQVKAFRLGLRVAEMAVDSRRRTAGRSKVSGRMIPVFRAGWGIIRTILHYTRAPLMGAPRRRQRRRSRVRQLSPSLMPEVAA